jgi:hypothetical protein
MSILFNRSGSEGGGIEPIDPSYPYQEFSDAGGTGAGRSRLLQDWSDGGRTGAGRSRLLRVAL